MFWKFDVTRHAALIQVNRWPGHGGMARRVFSSVQYVKEKCGCTLPAARNLDGWGTETTMSYGRVFIVFHLEENTVL